MWEASNENGRELERLYRHARVYYVVDRARFVDPSESLNHSTRYTE